MSCCSTVTLDKAYSFKGEQQIKHMLLSPRVEKEIKMESCKEDNYELVSFDSLPNFLKDNEFILNYYRSEWPWKQTLLSLFSVHNETLNIWTHLIGFFIFLALTICAVSMVPFGSQPEVNGIEINKTNMSVITLPSIDHMISSSFNWYLPTYIEKEIANEAQGTVTRWPFYAYLVGAMLCLFTSSACHLLSCHSEKCAYTMLRLDYSGISTLIVTSFYPLVYYSFMCLPFYRNLYISFITAFGIATILVSLFPVFQTPQFRSVRALLFFCMGVSGLVPILHKVFLFGHQPVAMITTVYELVMGLFYGVGVIVYAARVPERWWPGKFDLIGHSHQLFHVLVIAGAYTHYLASVMYLNWRDMEGQC
ncbi:AdipoR/hemolysin-III-related protein [Dioscorea alata]|uniref:AdipoR/hemolysin-III-related protein n=1 Tax=Dioscorea alata TaxID=55571 RepID=A0ACB7U0X8_DIOAL|nr:AdipoR/hemolysin-III-related protein [Dioscorea alata]